MSPDQDFKEKTAIRRCCHAEW